MSKIKAELTPRFCPYCEKEIPRLVREDGYLEGERHYNAKICCGDTECDKAHRRLLAEKKKIKREADEKALKKVFGKFLYG